MFTRPPAQRSPPMVRTRRAAAEFGDEGLAAVVAPPPAAGTPPPPAGGLKKLRELGLDQTQIGDAGCATLVAALDRGALPALEELHLDGIPASAEAIEQLEDYERTIPNN